MDVQTRSQRKDTRHTLLNKFFNIVQHAEELSESRNKRIECDEQDVDRIGLDPGEKLRMKNEAQFVEQSLQKLRKVNMTEAFLNIVKQGVRQIECDGKNTDCIQQRDKAMIMKAALSNIVHVKTYTRHIQDVNREMKRIECDEKNMDCIGLHTSEKFNQSYRTITPKSWRS